MADLCAIIPVYNHPDTIVSTVREILKLGLSVLLIDDGSDPVCAGVLQVLNTAEVGVHLKRLPDNRGKGAAVKAGLLWAEELGFSHALQIDADGQHNPEEIPHLIALSEKHPQAIISGMPEFDESVPRLRYYSRYLTHIWVWINTLSLEIRDSMCGFRVYPVAPVCQLIQREYLGDRMDYDSEVLVKWFWQGGRIVQVTNQVRYPQDGISHFRGIEDNWLITKMHARLFFGMLLRLPRLLRRRRPARSIST